MKVLAPVKRVLDHDVKPRVKAGGTGDLANVRMSISIGEQKAQETPGTALAMGAAVTEPDREAPFSPVPPHGDRKAVTLAV